MFVLRGLPNSLAPGKTSQHLLHVTAVTAGEISTIVVPSLIQDNFVLFFFLPCKYVLILCRILYVWLGCCGGERTLLSPMWPKFGLSWSVFFPFARGLSPAGGGEGGTSLYEANGDVPLDGLTIMGLHF